MKKITEEELVHFLRQGCLGGVAGTDCYSESAWPELEPADDTDDRPQVMDSSISYRVAVGPQKGQKTVMIRIIRPQDGRDPGWNERPRPLSYWINDFIVDHHIHPRQIEMIFLDRTNGHGSNTSY